MSDTTEQRWIVTVTGLTHEAADELAGQFAAVLRRSFTDSSAHVAMAPYEVDVEAEL